MPSLKEKTKLNENLSIGVQVGFGTTGVGYKDSNGNARVVGRGVWTCEIKFTGEPAIYRTTRVKYEPNSAHNKQEAMRVAYEIFSGFADRYGRGLSVTSVNYATNLADEFVEDCLECAALNERLKKQGKRPTEMMYGGRNFFTDRNTKQTERMVRLYLRPFLTDHLKPLKREPAVRIENITKRDWDEFPKFLARHHNHLSIESRLKIISELRKFLHWCYLEKKVIDDVPSIQRPHRGGVQGARQRMRKEITPEIYNRIIDYTREKYLDETRSEFHRDYSELFHYWIMLMSNCGIRCPGGATEHTLVKWEHIRLPKERGDTATLFRPDEKGHTYEAILMDRGVKTILHLKDFYKRKKISTKNGHLFRHPHNAYYGNSNYYNKGKLKRAKGDPILSFRTQWNNMAKDLNLHEFGSAKNRVPQSERISPASLRAWFITQRLYSDKNIKIELLARCTGTSIGQIEARYLRLDMDASYKYLSAGGYDDGGADEVWIDGRYAGTANSLYWKGRTIPDHAELRPQEDLFNN
jgi:hypothetical protein